MKIGQDHPPSIRRSDALIFIMIVFGLNYFGFSLGLLIDHDLVRIKVEIRLFSAYYHVN